ncbi:hypothetical protein PIB30_056470 [Stylosanthes scabra]|uniref:Uncharacterized protein n=1 Tax=Stylosanthes scabra TaxID=79078 RepID=A0ABU6YI47_9FABA|nr:hypothetical protein [Stylosanthes scabra]
MVRRAQFRPPSGRRVRGREPRGRGRDGAGVGRGEGGEGADVFIDGYVPLADDPFGGGDVSTPSIDPDFASPGTMERQLGREVSYYNLAAIWAQEEGKGSSSRHVVEIPEFHVDLNEPATGVHDVYFSFGGPLLLQHIMSLVPLCHPSRCHNHQFRSQKRMRTMSCFSSSVADILAQAVLLRTVWVHFIHVGPNPPCLWTSLPCPPLVWVKDDRGTIVRAKTLWE